MNRAYLSCLAKMRTVAGTEDLGANPAATIEAMDKAYTTFSSTRVALSALRKVYPDVKAFAEEIMKRKPEYVKIDENQKATQKQEESYISWDKVLEFRDQYYDVMTPTQRVLMALYTYIPPVRADYTPMRIVDKKPKKLEDGMNYVIMCKKPYFLFHAFKTHGTYGDQTVAIPVKLQEEIKKYLEIHPGEYMFQDGGIPWTSARLAETFKKIFQKFHSMDFGITMMRHSFITAFHKGTKPIKEMKAVSSKMMHSPWMNMTYRFISLED
jgi:hypothetical protein